MGMVSRRLKNMEGGKKRKNRLYIGLRDLTFILSECSAYAGPSLLVFH